MGKIKKRIISLILALIFTICILISSLPAAHAEPLSLASLASAAYAMGQASGITWAFTGGTETGAKSWMENKINSWLAGRSIIEAFGTEVLMAQAGKLIIPATLATRIAAFLNDLMYDVGAEVDNPIIASGGSYEGIPISSENRSFTSSVPQSGIGMYRPTGAPPTYPEIGASSGTYGISIFCINGRQVKEFSNRGSFFSFHYWMLTQVGNKIRCNYVTSTAGYTGGPRNYSTDYYDWTPTAQITDKLEVTLTSDYGYPEFPSDTSLLEATIVGAGSAATLEEILDLIDSDIPENALVISAEVVDPVPPTPVPTAVPTYPPADNVLDAVNTVINQGNDYLEDLNDINITAGGVLEGINDLIGVDVGVAEDVSDIAGTAEEVLEGIDNIGNDVGGIASDVGGIASDIGGIATDVGDIAGELEGVGEGVADIADTVGDIADALEPTEIQTQRIDLRTLFPFCIPFDIYRILSRFDASPQAPHVQLPLVIQSIGFRYVLDLDFSLFNPLAQAVRTVELIIYALGLAWATSKVIKW